MNSNLFLVYKHIYFSKDTGNKRKFVVQKYFIWRFKNKSLQTLSTFIDFLRQYAP